MSFQTTHLTPEAYVYYQTHAGRMHPVMEALRAKTRDVSEGHMQIAPEQATMLQFLMKLLNAKKTLEIGTFTGYSALAVALALPDDGKLIACDISEDWTAIAKEYWAQAGVAHKIDLRLAPALETLKELVKEGAAGTFDFVFIDADKQNYPAYYEASLPLLRAGGVIAIDNVLWYGRVADPSDQTQSTRVIRALNDYVHKDDRVDMCMVGIGDGLLLARKR